MFPYVDDCKVVLCAIFVSSWKFNDNSDIAILNLKEEEI